MARLPKTLHLDGTAEFKSKALRRGCGQYGIKLVYRERTHHGGHIERLIGTKMSKPKSLLGSTGGSPKARRSYDPDKHAALTLGELEAWFAQQIVGRCHQDPHRVLNGGTPAGAWALHSAPGLPPGPLKRFRIAFLPAISRTLRRDGIVFEQLRYWYPIFSQWLARRERLTLHFDPRNLSRLYVPHEEDYLEVPFSDLRMPAVSLWEVQAATRHLRLAGQKSINPSLLIEDLGGSSCPHMHTHIQPPKLVSSLTWTTLGGLPTWQKITGSTTREHGRPCKSWNVCWLARNEPACRVFCSTASPTSASPW